MDTLKAVRHFLDKAHSDDPVEKLVPALETISRGLGFSLFSYLLVKPREWLAGQSTEPVSVSNYPRAWMEHYLRNNYHFKDPTFIEAYNQQRPVRWGPAHWDLGKAELKADQLRILQEAGTYGIKRGLTVPINGPGNELGLFTVATGESAEMVDEALYHKGHILHVVATYAHAVIVAKTIQHLPPQEIDLTVREKEVLFWTAQGKSSWEISKIIDRSNATVNFHIKHAVRKLNASNKCHAAVKATVFQLIDPYDARQNELSDRAYLDAQSDARPSQF